jgi:hypothetical protein
MKVINGVSSVAKASWLNEGGASPSGDNNIMVAEIKNGDNQSHR